MKHLLIICGLLIGMISTAQIFDDNGNIKLDTSDIYAVMHQHVFVYIDDEDQVYSEWNGETKVHKSAMLPQNGAWWVVGSYYHDKPTLNIIPMEQLATLKFVVGPGFADMYDSYFEYVVIDGNVVAYCDELPFRGKSSHRKFLRESYDTLLSYVEWNTITENRQSCKTCNCVFEKDTSLMIGFIHGERYTYAEMLYKHGEQHDIALDDFYVIVSPYDNTYTIGALAKIRENRWRWAMKDDHNNFEDGRFEDIADKIIDIFKSKYIDYVYNGPQEDGGDAYYVNRCYKAHERYATNKKEMRDILVNSFIE